MIMRPRCIFRIKKMILMCNMFFLFYANLCISTVSTFQCHILATKRNIIVSGILLYDDS